MFHLPLIRSLYGRGAMTNVGRLIIWSTSRKSMLVTPTLALGCTPTTAEELLRLVRKLSKPHDHCTVYVINMMSTSCWTSWGRCASHFTTLSLNCVCRYLRGHAWPRDAGCGCGERIHELQPAGVSWPSQGPAKACERAGPEQNPELVR